jgi:hypothetical protein
MPDVPTCRYGLLRTRILDPDWFERGWRCLFPFHVIKRANGTQAADWCNIRNGECLRLLINCASVTTDPHDCQYVAIDRFTRCSQAKRTVPSVFRRADDGLD